MKKLDYLLPVLIGLSINSYHLGIFLSPTWLITIGIWIIATIIVIICGTRLTNLMKLFWNDETKQNFIFFSVSFLLCSIGLFISACMLGNFTSMFLGIGWIIWLFLGLIATMVVTLTICIILKIAETISIISKKYKK